MSTLTSRTLSCLLYALCWTWLPHVSAQQNADITIDIVPTFQGTPLALTPTEYLLDSLPIRFSLCKFYLGQFSLHSRAEKVWQSARPYQLFDLEDSTSHTLVFSPPAGIVYDHLQFTLGVDSATSASGIFGGDLDPMKGMYWSWNSGYINVKIEGYSPVAGSRRHQFFYHIGGYIAPNGAAQTVLLPLNQTGNYVLLLDLEKLIYNVDLSENYHIMSPGKQAVAFAQQLAQSFRLDAVEK